MTTGVLIALVLLAALVCAVLFVAAPRMRARSRPAGASSPPRRREQPEYAGDEPPRSRDEHQLMAEGEAIRDQVEAQLRTRGVDPARPPVDPGIGGDQLAWQLEQEQRERYPASFGAGADPTLPPRRRSSLSERDELAWQIEQDRLEREGIDPRDGVVRPMSNGLHPELLPVSDPLELQLQEIAVRSRPPAGWRNRRRHRRDVD